MHFESAAIPFLVFNGAGYCAANLRFHNVRSFRGWERLLCSRATNGV